jgi:broad-specificity NMP kinase
MTRCPNILVTGTPGTGKTSMCQQLAVRSLPTTTTIACVLRF